MTASAVATTSIEFLGVDFAEYDLLQTRLWVEAALSAPRFQYIVTPNVDHVVKLHKAPSEHWHADYRLAMASADLRINDSRILARLARLSGIPLTVVPGSDLTAHLVAHWGARDAKIVLIGGRDSELAWLRRQLPHATIAGYQPPMGVLHNHDVQIAIAECIEAEQPALTLFAIGAPQSEIVAYRVQQRGRCGGVGLCIGASVEFLSGTKSRAPVFLQKLGLEWAFRLFSEPRRMWRRYLIEGPRIFAIWYHWHRSQRQ